jgi:hypothetical protein
MLKLNLQTKAILRYLLTRFFLLSFEIYKYVIDCFLPTGACVGTEKQNKIDIALILQHQNNEEFEKKKIPI